MYLFHISDLHHHLPPASCAPQTLAVHVIPTQQAHCLHHLSYLRRHACHLKTYECFAKKLLIGTPKQTRGVVYTRCCSSVSFACVRVHSGMGDEPTARPLAHDYPMHIYRSHLEYAHRIRSKARSWDWIPLRLARSSKSSRKSLITSVGSSVSASRRSMWTSQTSKPWSL